MKKFTLLIMLCSILFSCSKGSSVIKKDKISPEKKSLLAYGAILSSRNYMTFDSIGYVINGLDCTKIEKEAIISMLKETWEVSDRKSALDNLNWLVNEGHRKDYDKYLYNLQQDNPEKYEGFDNDKKNYDDCVKMLKDNFNISDDIIRHVDLGAWDYDRIVTVARWSYIAEYITEEEAWKYCKTSKKLAQASFNSWDEYFVSHALGRAVAYEGDSNELIEVGQELLKSTKSIWKEIPFK